MEQLQINNHASNVIIQGHTFEKVYQFTNLAATVSEIMTGLSN